MLLPKQRRAPCTRVVERYEDFVELEIGCLLRRAAGWSLLEARHDERGVVATYERP